MDFRFKLFYCHFFFVWSLLILFCSCARRIFDVRDSNNFDIHVMTNFVNLERFFVFLVWISLSSLNICHNLSFFLTEQIDFLFYLIFCNSWNYVLWFIGLIQFAFVRSLHPFSCLFFLFWISWAFLCWKRKGF